MTAETFGRVGSMIRFQQTESKFNLCEVEQLSVIPRAPKAQDELGEWYGQFQKGLKDEFHGLFLPSNLVESFDSAKDASSSIVVAILIGTEKNRVSHLMLPPQWTTEGELNISAIPMEDIDVAEATITQ
ncbi:putative histone-arginine methyltransferase 1.4 [Raphanus sativus]|nr:putative histone-arginine methyltransferase 1.4 [Raphanus sativus]